MAEYVRRLNRFYQKHRSFYEIEDSWEGFQWLCPDDRDNSVTAFLRISRPWRGKRQQIVCLTNFTPVVRRDYLLPLPAAGTLRELFNSDSTVFGGSGVCSGEEIPVSDIPYLGLPASARVTVPPLATVYLEFEEAGKLPPEKSTADKQC